MSQRIALFWPGDLRQRPNELARPNAEEASLQIERALTKLGRQSYRVPDFISKPHHAIEKLGPIDDPLIGVCVHWFYGPHTTEGVVGKVAGSGRTLEHRRLSRKPEPAVLAHLDNGE